MRPPTSLQKALFLVALIADYFVALLLIQATRRREVSVFLLKSTQTPTLPNVRESRRSFLRPCSGGLLLHPILLHESPRSFFRGPPFLLFFCCVVRRRCILLPHSGILL